jgi:DNA-binding transcriptional MerR regulator
MDDEDYPAYSMGCAAQILGTTPAFLRSLDEARLLTPQRSGGGHRRYSRYQLRIPARVRVLIDHGTPLEAACRIMILEDQLAEALAANAALHASPAAPLPCPRIRPREFRCPDGRGVAQAARTTHLPGELMKVHCRVDDVVRRRFRGTSAGPRAQRDAEARPSTSSSTDGRKACSSAR